MKRRVAREHANKKALRRIVTTHPVRPPFAVLCDSSFLRFGAQHGVSNVVTLIEEALCNRCVVQYLDSTSKKIPPDTVAFLKGVTFRDRDENSGKEDQNERKQVCSVARATNAFVATMNHDTRKLLVGHMSLKLTLNPPAIWVEDHALEEGACTAPSHLEGNTSVVEIPKKSSRRRGAGGSPNPLSLQKKRGREVIDSSNNEWVKTSRKDHPI